MEERENKVGMVWGGFEVKRTRVQRGTRGWDGMDTRAFGRYRLFVSSTEQSAPPAGRKWIRERGRGVTTGGNGDR